MSDEALIFFCDHGTSAGHLALDVHQRELPNELEGYATFWLGNGAAHGE
ncbi:hypothetical protein [Streptomyces sp. SBT349]|nr:hypothetical protein [Streptomyces sp. SBT349]